MNAWMDAGVTGEQEDTMLAEVDFKWLMAGQGCWVDAVRLRQDSAYAHACFAQAQSLHSEPLARCVERLSDLLGASEATWGP